MNFKALGLSEPLLLALKEQQFETPTPIQEQSIPSLLNKCDLLGIAQTGTGKTAAFSLPILHELGEDWEPPAPKFPLSIILAPTRELAIQIGESIEIFGRHLPVRHTVIFGGVSQKHQVKALHRGVDIVVATPGRLLDLMNQGHISLKHIWHFVLDEADRMLDMGFIHDVKKIIAVLPKERQTLFFSATMPKSVSGLANSILKDPIRIEITPQSTPVERIDQSVYYVSAADKNVLLTGILGDKSIKKSIVFTRTKHRANRVAQQLQKAGITSAAIHGNKSQGARQKALKSFSSGEVRVLVATDIAARGIDIDNVSHVINFELPNIAEDYVHRIGRTARAGASGAAISMCDPGEQTYLRDIEKLMQHQLDVVGGQPSQDESKPTKRDPRQSSKRPAKSKRYRGKPKVRAA
ncbi:MAG: DEAD/DEAH box helicase [Methylocystaceae bacterium]|nr:DEAD/DEAH box helicase [Methylocystaceae bacterium]